MEGIILSMAMMASANNPTPAELAHLGAEVAQEAMGLGRRNVVQKQRVVVRERNVVQREKVIVQQQRVIERRQDVVVQRNFVQRNFIQQSYAPVYQAQVYAPQAVYAAPAAQVVVQTPPAVVVQQYLALPAQSFTVYQVPVYAPVYAPYRSFSRCY